MSMIIFFSGNVGCGKSTLAQYAAKKLGYYYLNADKYKKEIYSAHPNPEQFFIHGKPVPAAVRLKLYKKIGTELNKISKKIKNVVLDETLHTSLGRKKLIHTGKKLFQRPIIILVKSPLRQVKERNGTKRKGHLLHSTYQMHLSIKKIARFPSKPHLVINNTGTISASQKKLTEFLRNL